MGVARGIGIILLVGGITLTVVAIVWARMRKPLPPPRDPGIPMLTEHPPVTPAAAPPEPTTDRPDWLRPQLEPGAEVVPCVNCGRPVPVDFRFCDGCGTPLR